MLAVLLGLPVNSYPRYDAEYPLDSPWPNGHRGRPRSQDPVSVGLVGRSHSVYLRGAF